MYSMLKNHEQWVDAHFLYQPTAADEAVLADFRKKWGLRKSGAVGKGCNNLFFQLCNDL
jgi:hypothetical protein